MSGHSKWSQIKRQKGVTDHKRGQLFTKLGREISVAARKGGGDPGSNFQLRLAVQKARDSNMPMDNIDRAIKKGAGGTEATSLAEVTYEGYGPGGMAVIVNALSDNRNRTASEIRSTFTKAGGNLGETGSVGWLFDNRGVITLEAAKVAPDEIALCAIDAGAEDIKIEDQAVEVYTRPEDLEKVRKALEAQNVTVVSAELSMIPKTTVAIDEKHALQALKLMEKLEALDDVQQVYSNADFPNEVLAKYQSDGD
ncbi:MAG: YebC/PmpR family DNA-binding transcriptional regulator [Dehalococcoidia bacterium]|nr:YebC/PmpR family DNA-binding transcriptional regulator [Dehalococcoidia bacterium]